MWRLESTQVLISPWTSDRVQMSPWPPIQVQISPIGNEDGTCQVHGTLPGSWRGLLKNTFWTHETQGLVCSPRWTPLKCIRRPWTCLKSEDFPQCLRGNHRSHPSFFRSDWALRGGFVGIILNGHGILLCFEINNIRLLSFAKDIAPGRF